MPTVSGSGGEEVESQDEVKVFKYEGDEEESEKRSSENLTEDKSSLITETEEVRLFTLENLRPQSPPGDLCSSGGSWRPEV